MLSPPPPSDSDRSDGQESTEVYRQAEATAADAAFLMALKAWGLVAAPSRTDADTSGRDDGPSMPAERWIDPNWAARLRFSWGLWREAVTSAEAHVRLCRAHRETVQADLSRVHPSWMARALGQESPAVLALIAAQGPEPAAAVARQLGPASPANRPWTPPHPEVARWALTLWAERLVGGQSESANDPPVIRILTERSARGAHRVCRLVGIAKLAIAGREPADRVRGSVGQSRAEWFRNRLGPLDPRLGKRFERDIASVERDVGPGRSRSSQLGLITAARLLAECDPFRSRWALQHLPYEIAKLFRSRSPESGRGHPRLIRAETQILQAALERLTLEGWRARE